MRLTFIFLLCACINLKALSQTEQIEKTIQAVKPLPIENQPTVVSTPQYLPISELNLAESPKKAEPGEGMTVSLLNGTSKLKLYGQFSTIGQYATIRPFPSGGTLFLLPEAKNGSRSNTFDLHARQTAMGAIFYGPEFLGLTPSANFLGFIQNDNLTSDAYGFLPFNAYGELKNDQWRFSAGLRKIQSSQAMSCKSLRSLRLAILWQAY